MMRRTLFSAEHDRFREAFRAFIATEVRPNQRGWAEAGCVTREAWLAAGAGGFLATCVPAEYGGLGGDFLHAVVICEELARAHEFGFGLNLHSDVFVPYLLELGTEEQKARHLPACVSGESIGAVAITEERGGSDIAGLTTTARFVADDDEWELDGSKVFVSNGGLCDLVLVVVRTEGVPAPRGGLSLLLVDTRAEGVSRGRALRKLGFATQDTYELLFNRCRVPSSALLGEIGAAVPSLLQRLQQERLIVAVAALARAEVVLEETIEHARRRQIAGKMLAEYQNTQFRLAECATKVQVGRSFVDQLCAEHVRGTYLQKECAMAKLWTTEMLNEVADACLQLWGAWGTLTDHPVGRAYIDARLQRIYAGTNEVMKVVIGRELGLTGPGESAFVR